MVQNKEPKMKNQKPLKLSKPFVTAQDDKDQKIFLLEEKLQRLQSETYDKYKYILLLEEKLE